MRNIKKSKKDKVVITINGIDLTNEMAGQFIHDAQDLFDTLPEKDKRALAFSLMIGFISKYVKKSWRI